MRTPHPPGLLRTVADSSEVGGQPPSFICNQVWIPVTVVPTSLATVAIDTFMTELSSVIRNWAEASVSSTIPVPAAAPSPTRPASAS